MLRARAPSSRYLFYNSHLVAARRSAIATRRHFSLFDVFRRRKAEQEPAEPVPLLSQDDLFHPFSKSPFPAVRQRAEVLKKLAPCPVCASASQAPEVAQPKNVTFECPDCGWPTHCTEEHWKEDPEHIKYCSRLREANEDDHDLRSGRRLIEFEFPGPQDSEAAISFANWDVFWYTRGFPSMDTERSRRHSSKVLSYPITVGSVLHQYSNLTRNNQRLTPEGSRSLAALRSTLHVPLGTPETEEQNLNKPKARIFILGARKESSLPTHVWEQLTMLFPAGLVHLYFIGPQVALPVPEGAAWNSAPANASSSPPPPSANTTAESKADTGSPPSPTQEESTSTASGSQSSLTPSSPTNKYVPNIYQPPTPAPIPRLKRTRDSLTEYGVPSYTLPYTAQLSVTGLQANYMDVHPQFAETYDPYTDCFFIFHPGFGFPSPTAPSQPNGEPTLQIAAPAEWGDVVPALLQTKCAIFVTGFSPADVERDVRSLETAKGVAGEFDWIVTPGPNSFGSERWEVADFDPRVMVRSNWGIWGIRGKRTDVVERGTFAKFFLGAPS